MNYGTAFVNAAYIDIKELIGQTITKAEIVVADRMGQMVVFHTAEGNLYAQFHDQDCCESVGLEDVPTQEQLDAICGSPVVVAEGRSEDDPNAYEDGGWTFYVIRTNKATLDIRWYGESNGYYSIEAGFYRAQPEWVEKAQA